MWAVVFGLLLQGSHLRAGLLKVASLPWVFKDEVKPCHRPHDYFHKTNRVFRLNRLQKILLFRCYVQ